MIPKKIHYCWFGGNPLPKLARKCIKSWKKHCKGYEIVEWNEKNFDISQAPLYVRQAYEMKKWAFVSDYVRLYVLEKFGGIYLDTDVEIIKPINIFLNNVAILGFEDDSSIAMCFIACEAKLPIFSNFLEYYDNATFIKENGTLNLTTNVAIITKRLLNYGLTLDNTLQMLQGITIYPKDYFCPKSYETGKIEKTKNTVAIHHFSASWHTEEENKKHKKLIKEQKKKKHRYFIKTIPNRALRFILGEKNYEKLKNKWKKK